MDLRQFRYFIQAARRENFRKASEDLRIAQSALTRQIQLSSGNSVSCCSTASSAACG